MSDYPDLIFVSERGSRVRKDGLASHSGPVTQGIMYPFSSTICVNAEVRRSARSGHGNALLPKQASWTAKKTVRTHPNSDFSTFGKLPPLFTFQTLLKKPLNNYNAKKASSQKFKIKKQGCPAIAKHPPRSWSSQDTKASSLP